MIRRSVGLVPLLLAASAAPVFAQSHAGHGAAVNAAQPAVQLQVYDDAQGQRLTPQALAAQHPGPIDLWFCGPQGLGDALDAHAARGWRLHRESFAMR